MARKRNFDVTLSEKSIASSVLPLISKMNDMSFSEIKKEFVLVLSSDDTSASTATRKKWLAVVSKVRTKNEIMSAISNLYLKGGNLGVLNF